LLEGPQKKFFPVGSGATINGKDIGLSARKIASELLDNIRQISCNCFEGWFLFTSFA